MASRAIVLPGRNTASTHQDQPRLRNFSELVQAVLQNLYPSLHRHRVTTFVRRNRIFARYIWFTSVSVGIFCSDGLTHSMVVQSKPPVTKPQVLIVGIRVSFAKKKEHRSAPCRAMPKNFKPQSAPCREHNPPHAAPGRRHEPRASDHREAFSASRKR